LFNLDKTIQACNYLLEKNNSSLDYIKLIKLLYLADRESLKESLQSITGDVYVSMKNGPVLSKVYDLIMGRFHNDTMQEVWDKHFSRDEYDLIAKETNGSESHGELSAFEIQTLEKIYGQFEGYDSKEMIAYVHSNCPEWRRPKGPPIPIQTKNILESIGRTPDEIEWILAENEAFEEEEQAFVSLAGE